MLDMCTQFLSGTAQRHIKMLTPKPSGQSGHPKQDVLKQSGCLAMPNRSAISLKPVITLHCVWKNILYYMIYVSNVKSFSSNHQQGECELPLTLSRGRFQLSWHHYFAPEAALYSWNSPIHAATTKNQANLLQNVILWKMRPGFCCPIHRHVDSTIFPNHSIDARTWQDGTVYSRIWCLSMI